MTSAQPIAFEVPDRGEEAARADLYGLLATLFYAPPPQQLLDTIGAAQTRGDSVLEQAWADLSVACKMARAEPVREEYEALFVGVGKPEVMLYGSFYLSGFLMEKPLAALRTDLANLGLRRDEGIPESEDHIASLCEVMRHLIASEDSSHSDIAVQKKFFANHLQPWVLQMCDTVTNHPGTHFYAPVARLAKTFFEIEMQAFDMV